MTNTITNSDNTVLTINDLRKLISTRKHLLKSIVHATTEEDVDVATLTERAIKLKAMSEALKEAFTHFYAVQEEHLNANAAYETIRDLICDEIGMTLALANLARLIGQESKEVI